LTLAAGDGGTETGLERGELWALAITMPFSGGPLSASSAPSSPERSTTAGAAAVGVFELRVPFFGVAFGAAGLLGLAGVLDFAGVLGLTGVFGFGLAVARVGEDAGESDSSSTVGSGLLLAGGFADALGVLNRDGLVIMRVGVGSRFRGVPFLGIFDAPIVESVGQDIPR
jgi:hypothetical protein